VVYFLSTTSTGYSKKIGGELLEVAVLRSDGEVVFDSLVRPKKPLPANKDFHGITAEMLSKAPGIEKVRRDLYERLSGELVVIYDAAWHLQWFPKLSKVADTSCCMLAYTYYYGEYDASGYAFVEQRLMDAARQIRFTLPPNPYRALSKAAITRAVWYHMLDNPEPLRDYDYEWVGF